MAQQPTQQTIKQTTLIMEEEFTPPGGVSIAPYGPQPEGVDQQEYYTRLPRGPTPPGRPADWSQIRGRRLNFEQPQSPNLMTFSPDSSLTTNGRPCPGGRPGSPARSPPRPCPGRQPSGSPTRSLPVGKLVSFSPEGSPHTPVPPAVGKLVSFSPEGSPHTPVPPPGYRPDARPLEASPPDTVTPNLEDMLNIIQFGMTEFVRERNRHINDLQHVLQRNLDSVVEAQNKLCELDSIIEKGSQFIPAFIQTWGNHAQYYTQVHDECANPDNPIPDLRNIGHPSSEITQESYRQLIWQIVVLCHRAERHMRLNEVMYSSLDETLEDVTGKLKQMLNSFKYFDDLRVSFQKEDQDLLKGLGDAQHQVNRFLQEWQRVEDKEGKISCPQVPMQQPRAPCPTPAAPRRAQSPTLSGSSPDTPTDEQIERVKELRKKKEMVEGLVQRYNEFFGTVMREINSIRDQQDVLEQSAVAMRNVPEDSGAP